MRSLIVIDMMLLAFGIPYVFRLRRWFLNLYATREEIARVMEPARFAIMRRMLLSVKPRTALDTVGSQ